MSNIVNFFINKKKIAIELPKASFINIPGYAEHIGFWISNKFIYPSQKFQNQVAIGIIKTNSYQLIKYLKDQNNKNVRNDWKILSGEKLIFLFEKEKENINKQFGRNIKVPTFEEDKDFEFKYKKFLVDKELNQKNINDSNEKLIDDEILWN